MKVSGDDQQGAPGAALDHPFVVSVLDKNGYPFAGATVVFAVTSGEGRLSIETTVTNSSGTASSVLTLGDNSGKNTVTVTVAGIDQPVTFIAEAQATPDFDGDGTVGFVDFVQFAKRFGLSPGDAGFDARYDLDGDGTIGFGDFVIFAKAFGKKGSWG